MNDRYEALLGIAYNSEYINHNKNWEELLSSYTVCSRSSEYPKGNFLINLGGMDCREYLLSRTTRESNKFVRNGEVLFSVFPVFLFVKFTDNVYGRPMDSSTCRKIDKFADSIVNNKMSKKIYIRTENGYGYLRASLYDDMGRIQTLLSSVSFFLYLVRKEEIMNWAITTRENNPVIYTSTILQELSTKFLENSEWGNGSNENVLMSLFSFFLASSEPPTFNFIELSGPAEFAGINVPASIIKKYVNNVVLRFMTERKKSFNKNSNLESVLPIHTSIRDEFKIILKSLIISERKTE